MRAAWFWALGGAIVVWGAFGLWLDDAIGWPERYGFPCHGRNCIVAELWHSPVLIDARHRRPFEILEFLWLWAWPIFGIALYLSPSLKTPFRHRNEHNPE